MFDSLSSYSFTALTKSLLEWYDHNRRALPWRVASDETPDPYRIWVSEIMLQQTTVATVKPYFCAFITRWPTLNDLAHADLDDVLKIWSGLGYYARAHNIHKCAQLLIITMGKMTLPSKEEDLRRLPGIGIYTAAAITAIAFGQRAVVLDSNIRRVVTRLFSISSTSPRKNYSQIYTMVDSLTPTNRCGDFVQAVMDLGSMVCTSRRQPTCLICPLRFNCSSAKQNTLNSRSPLILAGAKKQPRKIKYGLSFYLLRDDGAIFMRRRQRTGLLGGMMEIPSTPWRTGVPWTLEEATSTAEPLSLAWIHLPGVIRHYFTHFRLEFQVVLGHVTDITPVTEITRGKWFTQEEISNQALSSLTRKIIAHVLMTLHK